MDSPNKIIGTLDAFYETGTEGIYWALIDNSKTGYDALNILEDGDYLFIEDGNKGIEWEGRVNLDRTSRKIPHPLNANFMQQEINGYWVHGVQSNVDPLLWFDWFSTSRPAVLIKG